MASENPPLSHSAMDFWTICFPRTHTGNNLPHSHPLRPCNVHEPHHNQLSFFSFFLFIWLTHFTACFNYTMTHCHATMLQMITLPPHCQDAHMTQHSTHATPCNTCHTMPHHATSHHTTPHHTTPHHTTPHHTTPHHTTPHHTMPCLTMPHNILQCHTTLPQCCNITTCCLLSLPCI